MTAFNEEWYGDINRDCVLYRESLADEGDQQYIVDYDRVFIEENQSIIYDVILWCQVLYNERKENEEI